jgi:hypothetical protein
MYHGTFFQQTYQGLFSFYGIWLVHSYLAGKMFEMKNVTIKLLYLYLLCLIKFIIFSFFHRGFGFLFWFFSVQLSCDGTFPYLKT